MVRFLCIVAQDQPELCDYLTAHFAQDETVRVTLDRRRGERRRERARGAIERRRLHRRWHPNNQETLSAVGVFMVPLDRDATTFCPVS